MKRHCVFMALVALASVQGSAAPAAARAEMGHDQTAASVLREVRSLIAAHYVRPELRPALEKKLAAAHYSMANPPDFAERVTSDLSDVAHDKHLYLRYSPEEAKLYRSGFSEEAAGQGELAAFSHQRNHGITEMRLLEGNVRYVRIDTFLWAGDESRDAYDTAMRFLAQGDAAVIDLRGNGGGDGNASKYLVSHFVPEGTPLMTFYLDGKVAERSTAAAVPQDTRMIGKPLYVLTGPRSASAAEEFIGLVKALRLGDTIGEKSAGAGYNNALYPVGNDFVLSVSVGRAEITATGEGWEQTGFAPTIAASVPSALQVAQARAFRTLATKATNPSRLAELQQLASVAERAASAASPAHPIQSYAAAFGARTVSVAGNALLLERPGSMPAKLVSIGDDKFAVESDLSTTVEFQMDSDGPASLTLIRSDGSRSTQVRTR